VHDTGKVADRRSRGDHRRIDRLHEGRLTRTLGQELPDESGSGRQFANGEVDERSTHINRKDVCFLRIALHSFSVEMWIELDASTHRAACVSVPAQSDYALRSPAVGSIAASTEWFLPKSNPARFRYSSTGARRNTLTNDQNGCSAARTDTLLNFEVEAFITVRACQHKVPSSWKTRHPCRNPGDWHYEFLGEYLFLAAEQGDEGTRRRGVEPWRATVNVGRSPQYEGFTREKEDLCASNSSFRDSRMFLLAEQFETDCLPGLDGFSICRTNP